MTSASTVGVPLHEKLPQSTSKYLYESCYMSLGGNNPTVIMM